MQRDLEHPDITMAIKTGYPYRRFHSPCVCHQCDGEIEEGDHAYDLGGYTYCEACVRDARFEV